MPVSPADEPSSDRIAHYQILRQLGRGGQATVYLAEDTRLHRQVALKVLDIGPAANKQAVERFRREAAIASKLDHPGICPVYETGDERGVLWIAMRYVEGRTLAQDVATARSSGLTEGESFVEFSESAPSPPPNRPSHPPSGPSTWTAIEHMLLIFEKAARALHAAHEAGIVHRDIKPGNIMVTKDGDPVILDFGLAQELDGDQPTLTLTGDIMGTPAYMSPEQIAAQRIRLDRRTDVYSLGVTLYECLTLRRPFDEPTRERLYQAILTKTPVNVRALNAALPADVKVVLETALEKDRDRRYQTALDFAQDVERLRKRIHILAKPIGPLVRLAQWSHRNPALAASVAGLFAVLALGLTIALFLLGQRDQALAGKDTALSEKAKALVDVTTERNEKSAALSDYDRLGDLSRLQSLVAEADKLWPCEPSKAGAMNDWVKQGSDLERRLPGHREVLERLRASAGLLPYTDQDRAEDLASHAAEQEQLGDLRKQRDTTTAELAEAESRESQLTESHPADTSSRAASRPSIAYLRSVLLERDAEIQRLDSQSHERLTFKFGSTSEQFKHDTTGKLVSELTAFVDPDPKIGLLAHVRGRLAFAQTVERETIVKYEKKWADAIQSIADKNECPKYGGLKIKPELGLIPIGRHKPSGLWAFVHLQTTAPGTDPIPKPGKDGRLAVTESTGLVFILIPGGTFKMGAVKPDETHASTDPNVDPDADIIESPITEVRLDPFFLSKYEMTQGQWLRLVGKNPSGYGPGTNFGGKVVNLRYPVESVSYDDCDLWLGRLGLILPTEAQWEYAARGGTTTPRWIGIGTDGLVKVANVADEFCRQNGGSPSWKYESWNDGYTVPAPVGSFASSPFCLDDVLGNVWEVCRDWYGGYDVAARPGDGLRTPSAPRFRVIRGGSFDGAAAFSRSAIRGFHSPTYRGIVLGVRPARSVSKP